MNIHKEKILEILRKENDKQNKIELGDYSVESVQNTFDESGINIEAIENCLTEEKARIIVDLGQTISNKKFKNFLRDNKENLTGSSKDNNQGLKKIILEILRGSNAHNGTKIGEKREAIRESVRESGAKIDLIEQHLTEESAQNFIKETTGGFYISKFKKWLEQNESLLSSSTENNGNQNQNPPKKNGNQQDDSQSQNQNRTQTTLNENWEKGVQVLISGQTDLNNLFSDAMNSWKIIVEDNKQVAKGTKPESERQNEKGVLNKDEFVIASYFVPQVDMIWNDLLEQKLKGGLKNAEKNSLISTIENKYHIKLSKTSKKKTNLLAKFVCRELVENILTSDPFTQSEVKNSWEGKILDLASQSFVDNAERKVIAQRLSYLLIARGGFSTTHPAVEKKANEFKDLLSKYQVSLDLSDLKKMVSEMLRTFCAELKGNSISVSWIVPSEADKIDGINTDEEFNHSSLFPIFPCFKYENRKIITRIRVESVDSWDQSKPVEMDNNSPDTTVPDLSSAKEQAAKERENRQKQETEAVKNATKNLNSENLTEEEKLNVLEEIETKEGKKSYQAEETEIEKGKKVLFTKNSAGYKKTMAKVFKKKLTDNGLTEAEFIKAVEEWENSKVNDFEEVKKSEKVLNQKIGQAGAKKRVNTMEGRIKQVLKTGDKKKMFAILKDLLVLFNDAQDSVYLSEYKNQIKNQVEDLEKAISGEKTNASPNKGFFQPKVLIPVGIGAVILVGIVVAVICSRRKNKTKTK